MSKNPPHPSLEQIELSSIFEAVSDPIRRKILLRLAEGGESNCSTFLVYAPKTNLSYHMGKLREAGIIRTRYEGTQRFSVLRKEDLDQKFPGLIDMILKCAKSEAKEEFASTL